MYVGLDIDSLVVYVGLVICISVDMRVIIGPLSHQGRNVSIMVTQLPDESLASKKRVDFSDTWPGYEDSLVIL